MVKTKGLATKSKTANPMIPPASPEELIPQVVLKPTSPSIGETAQDGSSTEYNLSPLPKSASIRSSSNHCIFQQVTTEDGKREASIGNIKQEERLHEECRDLSTV